MNQIEQKISSVEAVKIINEVREQQALLEMSLLEQGKAPESRGKKYG